MSKNFVYGFHAIETLLRTRADNIEKLLACERKDHRASEIRRQAESLGVTVERASQAQLDQISGRAKHQGLLAWVSPQTVQNEAFLKDLVLAEGSKIFLLVLDEIQDPHNLGACLRSADGAGVSAVVTPRRRSAGLSPATRKVASGAAETIPLVQVTNLARMLRWLAEQGVQIVGLAGETERSLYDAVLTGPLALVLGGEGKGLRRLTRDHCQTLAALPMHGAIDSLNVSVAAGICLYEALRQRTV
ncbi:MAG: 23S rRNA (guanosine(2251)-2'-O)-methyltransferase RlmB [Gammaproteobacteria bacterium]|nr:23S rRNA (guanosine(2251)-2'-O)-methyltransferase RlmB [Gammaproteobacteria bacterium]